MAPALDIFIKLYANFNFFGDFFFYFIPRGAAGLQLFRLKTRGKKNAAKLQVVKICRVHLCGRRERSTSEL